MSDENRFEKIWKELEVDTEHNEILNTIESDPKIKTKKYTASKVLEFLEPYKNPDFPLLSWEEVQGKSDKEEYGCLNGWVVGHGDHRTDKYQEGKNFWVKLSDVKYLFHDDWWSKYPEAIASWNYAYYDGNADLTGDIPWVCMDNNNSLAYFHVPVTVQQQLEISKGEFIKERDAEYVSMEEADRLRGIEMVREQREFEQKLKTDPKTQAWARSLEAFMEKGRILNEEREKTNTAIQVAKQLVGINS